MATTDRGGQQGRTRRGVHGLLVMALVAATLTGGAVGALPTTAAQAVPGVPNAPVLIFREDFENAPDTGNPQLLTNYVSDIGGTYTASSYWSSAAWCNGFILSTTNTQTPGSCQGDTGGYASLRKLAYALGTINGSANPLTNSIDAAYTYGGTQNNEIEFATVNPIPLATPSRYLTFSVNAAATNCFSNHPRLQFFVKNANGTETPLGGVIDPCSDPRSVVLSTGGLTGGSTQPYRGGSFPASGSFIASGNTVGLVMRNLTGTGAGNDGAFDDIRVLDATPQLDKSFGTPDPVTGVSRLTFTLTNTSDLASKLGWRGTDTLSPGLVVASPANAATTCSSGVITAPAGGAAIDMSGNLLTDQVSCTFSVNVAPATPTTQGAPPQVFQNCASNLSNIVGWAPPAACTTGSFPPIARLAVTKTSTATADTRAGDRIDYTVTVRNTGGSDYTTASPATLTDDLSGVLDDATYNNDVAATRPGTPTVTGSTLSWSGALPAGASTTITYSATATLAGDADLRNTACVPAAQADGAACATVDVPVVIAPSISLVKSATPTGAANFVVGQQITYTFVATNTGNVDLSDPVVVEGVFTGSEPMSVLSCPTTPVLTPGAQLTCTATYTLTQEDIDAGTVINDATASGTPPTGPAVTSPRVEVSLPADQVPTVGLVKTANPTAVTRAGDVVTYSFRVTNTGNVTLNDPTVAETAFSGTGPAPVATCPTGPVLPGQSVTCTATYPVTQADIDTGTVTNTATASAAPPSGPSVVSTPSSAVVTAAAESEITLVKTADRADYTASGASVTYTFVATNTGDVTLTDPAIDEVAFTGSGPLSALSCPSTSSLAPDAQLTCTATYTLTQADVDAGSVTNAATATGTPPTGAAVTSPRAQVVLRGIQSPAITLVKTVDPATVTSVGQQVTYSFLVTNTGNVTLTEPNVNEGAFNGSGLAPVATCPTGPLAPSQAITCTGTYSVTQADINAGQVTNTATANGLAPGGALVTSDLSAATVTATRTPAISLVKSAAPSDAASFTLGRQITYTFVATNTGNVALTNPRVTEGVFTGSGPLSALSCPPTPSLAPAAQLVCTATYTLRQGDIDRGSVVNDATATGTPPAGPAVTSARAQVVLPGIQSPAITLVKTADPTTITQAGQQIAYSFVVTNTGNVTLTDPGVTETAFSGSGAAPVISCPAGPLAPGQTRTCTAGYTSTQADVDAGRITNTATSRGTPPSGPAVVSAPSSATVSATQTIAIDLVKSASPLGAADFVLGQQVTYTFVATNTGNVTLADPVISEGVFTGSGTPSDLSCPPTTSLAPSEQLICTATYTLEQGDIDRGSVTNDATASATPPSGSAITSPRAEVVLPGIQSPAVSLLKTANPVTASAAGDEITYSFLVTNAGNVTLTAPSVTETAFTGTGAAPVATCPAVSLAPGENTTCTAAYLMTQADIDTGRLTNTATASATPPTGPAVDSAPSTAVVTATPLPSIVLVKSASPSDAASFTLGRQITYTFVATNTGNVTLAAPRITEGVFTGSDLLSAVSCPPTPSLAPDAQLVCTATYTLTQEDIDAGSVSNDATASGTPPTGPDVTSPPDDVVLPGIQSPEITLLKTATPSTITNSGTEIAYSFLVTNTGNVTLTDPTVAETAFSGTGSAPVIVCPAGPLAPGQNLRCTATYLATQDDIDAAQITNTAIASATGPNGAAVDADPSTALVDVEVAPAISLTKSATPSDAADYVVGQEITYTFVATNSGNTTLTDPVITEGLFTGSGALSPLSCPSTPSLVPGGQLICTATYTLTQSDVDRGSLSNDATATAAPPSGAPVTSSRAEVVLPGIQSPAIALVKSADRAAVTATGDQITYSFLVTNTGNVTLTDPTVTETAFSGAGPVPVADCPAGALAPGQHITCTATYAATGADLDAGHVANTASATGTPPSGDSVTSAPSTVEVDAVPPPPGSDLSTTGVDFRPALVLGLLLTALGAGLAWRARRRSIS